MNKVTLAILLAIIALSNTDAQRQNYRKMEDEIHPVQWSFSVVNKTRKSATVLFKASIAFGWHIYSSTMADTGPVPTQFEFITDHSWSHRGPLTERGNPVRFFDSTYMINIGWYEDSVTFAKPIKLLGKEADISGELVYMACRDGICLRPEIVKFKIPVSPLKLH